MLTNIAKTTAKRFNLQQIRLSHNASLQEIVANELKTIKSEGTFKVERAIVSRQGSNIQVESDGTVTQEINLCANNYLGLSSHPKVIQKAKEYLESHGAGLSSVRFICGTQDIHNQLEKQISKFYGTEDTILYASCFDANAGIFEVLLKEQDAIISDSLNHASIIDGVRLCKAKRYRYQNTNMEDLERQLKLADENGARLKMIATDGVFSMDGRIAPLDQICDLAEKYNAVVFVDDCHATGFLGKTGRGTPELFGVQNRVHLINSTLGKALGGASGGYTTGNKDIIALLRQRSRPYLFSNSLPPPVVGAASAALELVDAEPQLREQLWKNTRYFRDTLKNAGFNVKGDDHPIAPIMLGDARLANEFATDIAKKGIYVIGFSYPVVPKDLARIRVQLSAAISDDQIKKAVDAFIDIGKSRNIIS